MKLIKKLINALICILSLVILAILINLLIWWYRCGSFTSYITWLEEKNWNDEIKMVTRNPTTWPKLFYVQPDISQIITDSENIELLNSLDAELSAEFDSGDIELLPDSEELWDPIVQENVFVEEPSDNQSLDDTANSDDIAQETNPYDPDFEDEFNSFFAWN